jgi:hypothetical protein
MRSHKGGDHSFFLICNAALCCNNSAISTWNPRLPASHWRAVERDPWSWDSEGWCKPSFDDLQGKNMQKP